jgi:hypothetical protein
MSTVQSFVEESCWDGDYLRSVRKRVTFRVVSLGKLNGERQDFELEADFGIWYDPDNVYLLALLRDSCPSVDWERYIFHAMLDYSQIDVLDPIDDSLVATIRVRRRMGGDPSGESDRTNVTSMVEFRLTRLKEREDDRGVD